MSPTVDHGVASTSPHPAGRLDPDGITITELARNLGTTVRALRYYEQVDILKPDRTRGNARRYGPEMRFRAKLIVRLRRANVPMRCIVAATTSERVRIELLSEPLRRQLVVAQEQMVEIVELLGSMQTICDKR